MNFYPVRFSPVFQKIFPSLLFRKVNKEKKIYLSFDDGPTPEITDWVLDMLNQYHARATFFCVGKKLEKHSKIIERIIKEQHSIGNHTFQHLKGWKTNTNQYVESVQQTEKILKKFFPDNSREKIFRPPYGRIKPSQIKALKKLKYRIVMWTTVSGDYSASIDIKNNINSIINKTKSGDILVFHDSEKAFPQLKQILPEVLEKLTQKGYLFEKI